MLTNTFRLYRHIHLHRYFHAGIKDGILGGKIINTKKDSGDGGAERGFKVPAPESRFQKKPYDGKKKLFVPTEKNEEGAKKFKNSSNIQRKQQNSSSGGPEERFKDPSTYATDYSKCIVSFSQLNTKVDSLIKESSTASTISRAAKRFFQLLHIIKPFSEIDRNKLTADQKQLFDYAESVQSIYSNFLKNMYVYGVKIEPTTVNELIEEVSAISQFQNANYLLRTMKNLRQYFQAVSARHLTALYSAVLGHPPTFYASIDQSGSRPPSLVSSTDEHTRKQQTCELFLCLAGICSGLYRMEPEVKGEETRRLMVDDLRSMLENPQVKRDLLDSLSSRLALYPLAKLFDFLHSNDFLDPTVAYFPNPDHTVHLQHNPLSRFHSEGQQEADNRDH